MGLDYEACRIKLENLLRWYESDVTEYNRNEATTRLQLIDSLLFECLGWEKGDCTAEEEQGKEYTDYTLFCPWRSLIVEAKKEGVYFEIPAGYSKLEYSLKSLCRDNQDIKKAVEQVMRYCQNRGTPLGAVCNGHQLVCFIASRDDGEPPLDGKAIVFSSLQRMLNDFLRFWQYLSKPGVQDKNLQKHLLGTDIFHLPKKLSNSILYYPDIKGRNVLQTDLQIVGELVIEDVAKTREIEPDFIRECYCPSGALPQYALISKSILEHRYAALFNTEPNGPTIIPAKNKKGLTITNEIFAESLSKRPILLLGDVGVGKTMFMRYFIKVEGAEIMKNTISLYVDLGSKAALSIDLRTFFLTEIENQLFEDYNVDIKERNFVRGVYHFALLRFSQGIYADLKETHPQIYSSKELKFLEEHLEKREEHLKESLNHLSKGRKKQIVFFIDNADQRDENTQQQAFLIAQEVAANWPVTVFLALRPQTFHKSKKLGALSGYHPKAFTISPPRVDEVIRKRLLFASAVAEGKVELKSIASTISVKLRALQKYLNVLIYSFDINKDLIEFIDNVCSGNIRLALEFITTFIGSGHVDTQKILDIEDKQSENKHYLIPLHEFMRAVIYGDNVYYDSQKSSFANLFDISTFDGKEHFLLLILLEYIDRASAFAGVEGFVETTSIYNYAQCVGFTPKQIKSALGIALDKNLLETGTRYIPNSDDLAPRSFRVTTLGVYHLIKLVRYFTYVDAIIVDTPILEENIRVKITDAYTIEERLSRAITFCDYLDKQWTMIDKNAVGFKWSDVSRKIREDIEKIRMRIS